MSSVQNSKSSTPKNSNNKSSKKSSNTNISMKCEKYFKTFNLIPNRKEPTCEWNRKKGRFLNKHLWKSFDINTLQDWETPKSRGLPTGKINDCIVIDLDFYDKYDKEGNLKSKFDFENNSFIKEFGGLEEVKQRFNESLIVQTARGGLHLYFKYDPTIKTTTNSSVGIDIRSDGGYVVSMGTQIDKSVYDGRFKGKKELKKGTYEVVNDKPINTIPVELAVWLQNNLWRKKTITKPIKKDTNGNIQANENAYEQDAVDLSSYTYDFGDDELRKILDGLDDRYFTDNNDWIIFSTAMMTLGKFEIWDEYSKKRGGDKYNKEHNHQKWHYKVFKYKTFLCLEHLLCNSSYITQGEEDTTEIKKKATQYLGYYKYKPTNCHTIQPDVLLEKDRKYLDAKGDGSFLEYEYYGNVVCASDTGTGKTTAMKNYIKSSNCRFISIVSRITLGEEQTRVFKDADIDCHWHKDIDEEWYKYEGENIVITIDSLMKMGHWKDFNDYVIYLDEFNSLIEYFVGCPNLDTKRTIIKDFLNKILTQSDRVIGTDADISDNSLLYLKQLGLDYKYIKNQYRHNKGIKAEELYSYDELMENLYKLDKFMVCCDSKMSCIKIHDDLLSKGFDKSKMVCITSDTTEAINLDDYDIVIFSPKIVYGLDSVMEREVFAFMKGQTISPTAMVQQIARCRNIKKLSFLFQDKTWKPYKFEDVDECRSYMLNGMNRYRLSCGYGDEMDEDEANFNELVINFEYLNDCFNTNKFAHFLNIIKTRGFEYEVKVEKSSGIGNQITKKYKEQKVANFQEALEIAKKDYKWHQLEQEPILEKCIKLVENRKEYNGSRDELQKEFDELHSQIYEIGMVGYVDFEDEEEYILSSLEILKEEGKEQIKINARDKVLEKHIKDGWAKVIDLLNIPLEDWEKFADVITCEKELNKYFCRKQYFINEIDYEAILKHNKDFNIKKFQSEKNKIIFINKLKKEIDMVDDVFDFKMKNIVSDATAQKLLLEYKSIFGRCRQKDNPFSTAKGCKSIIIKEYKNLFSKDIIITKSTTKINPKTKKTEKVYKYSLNMEMIEATKTLSSYCDDY